MKSRTILVFNTGRTYTEHGQRIAATKWRDSDVLFHDVDRGIHGVIRNCPLEPMAILEKYDAADYTFSPLTDAAELPLEERTDFWIKFDQRQTELANAAENIQLD